MSMKIGLSQIPALEDSVKEMGAGRQPYSFATVRLLCKHYKLFGKHKPELCIQTATLLTLIHQPNDVLALSYLVPLPSDIQKCWECLQACQFADFWTAFDSIMQKESVTNVDAIAKLQGHILSRLQLSYKSAPKALVERALNVTTLPPTLNVQGESVVFADSVHNTPRVRVYQSGMPFASVNTLLHNMMAQ